METEFTPFMKDLESRFKSASGLPNRSHYKIFYGQIRPAPILTLGINPGGDPSNTDPDGLRHKDGKFAAVSASYFENDKHDILDCEWKENNGLRKILIPLLGNDTRRIRSEVVKSNLAFHRSARASQIKVKNAIDESAPFLAEIIDVVRPKLILLTGPKMSLFTDRFSSNVTIVGQPEKDPGVKQTVFAAAQVILRGSELEVLVVQVAHASQFSWTYERYSVVDKIHALTNY